jgi:hypothetical protein
VRLFVFTPVDLETALIEHYKDSGLTPVWQHSGFGSNDPGRQRDTSALKESHFDRLYPINIRARLTLSHSNLTLSAADLLLDMKQQTTFLIRFQRAGGTAPHADLRSTNITVRQRTDTVEAFLRQLHQALGTSWKVTVLPGYVVIYKNDTKSYPETQLTLP